MNISPAQLKEFLFSDLHTRYADGNAIRIRCVLDHNDCIYIPAWLALQIKEDPAANMMFYVQNIEGHSFLWATEVWANSRDRRLARVNSARAAIAADLAAVRANTALTKYQGQCYEFLNKLADRIVDNYYPSMKKGFLKQTFQKLLVEKGYDLARVRDVLDESFPDGVLDTCWVNEPIKSYEDDRQGNQEDHCEHQQIEACSRSLPEAQPARDRQPPDEEGTTGEATGEAGYSGCELPSSGEEDAQCDRNDAHGSSDADDTSTDDAIRI